MTVGEEFDVSDEEGAEVVGDFVGPAVSPGSIGERVGSGEGDAVGVDVGDAVDVVVGDEVGVDVGD